MKNPKVVFATVDEYIASFPEHTRAKLEELRRTIKKAAPKADELISYGMAGYKQHGAVAYFAGYKKHIGLYPRPSDFKKELEQYAGGRGTIQLPLDKPLPLKLIATIIKHRVAMNKENAKIKATKKKSTR